MKKIVIGITVIVAIFLIGLCAWYSMNSQDKYSGKPGSIAIGNMHMEGSTLIYIAQDQGFFTDNGLNVSIRDYDTGVAAINGLENGDVDVAVSGEYPLVGDAFNNESIQTIGSMDKSEIIYMVFRKDHGIENITDLKGKKIGVPSGTLPEFYLGRLLDLHGMNLSDVTLVNMDPSHADDALYDGSIDAVVNWQPYTNTIEARLGSNAGVWPVQSDQQSFGLLISRDDWIRDNPGLVNRFLKSLDQAETYAINHPADAKAIVRKQMNYTDAYMDTVWQQNQFSLSLDQSLIAAMDDEGRWMINNNLTTNKTIPNYTNYIYTKGIEEVKPESVNIIG